ncbi:hypothetical protein ESCO_004613 [Escovopsis weberi]|uniref:Uncharacterized protein n=1 Tax=Escovopsis weberi TaxID=150374 RepID=A0A0M9VRJ2_ESCWE|nr:hypothetical protein ESCO_004613 [Escovopsis weberi]
MSKYKDMAMAKASDLKGGMSNIKGGVKGKVNGVLGRKSSTDSSSDHVARPISTLRDPDSFAPPPRRTSTGLSEPPPRETAPRRVVMAPSKYQDPRGPRVEPPPKISSSRQLLEAPPEEDDDDGEEGEQQQPLPYRMNTTGLSTGHLPPPPTRRDGANEKSPPSYDSPMSARRAPPQAQSTAPSLPPRLPPRLHSTSSDGVINALPNPGNLMNQGAVSRLGAAGIAVSGLGIGNPSSSKPSDEDPAPPKPPRPVASQPNLLQSRMFNKAAAAAVSASPFSSSAENVAAQPSGGGGTTWAQKQAALKTASAFHKDPTSVSFADAKAAASTANNFRQRHGHQVAAGLSAASDINQKYGVAERIGALSSQHSAGGGHSPSSSTASITAGATAVSALAGKKKPPPPPPAKKKPSLAGPLHNGGGGGGGGGAPNADDDAPPPVPFATRPTF